MYILHVFTAVCKYIVNLLHVHTFDSAVVIH